MKDWIGSLTAWLLTYHSPTNCPGGTVFSPARHQESHRVTLEFSSPGHKGTLAMGILYLCWVGLVPESERSLSLPSGSQGLWRVCMHAGREHS